MLSWDKQNVVHSLHEQYCKEVREKYCLTQMQFDIIMFLYSYPQYDTASDIVRIRHLTKSHVSLALSNLELKQLIKIEFQRGNRKNRHISLTPKAMPIAADGKDMQERFFRTLFEGFSASDIEQCRYLFDRICNNANMHLKEYK